jgi:hypothetical protein
MHHGAVGNDGGVFSRPDDACLADGQVVAIDRLGLEPAVKKFVLAENHRVIDRHRIDEHVIRIRHRRRGQYHQPGVLGINPFHALAVERARTRRATRWQAHGDRDGHAGAVKMRGGLIDDLVEGDRREIRKLHLNDRPHALDGRTHGQTDHRIFRERAIKHTIRKLLRQSLGRLEGPAEGGDVLAIEKHARIFAQQGFLRLTDGIDVGNAHG